MNDDRIKVGMPHALWLDLFGSYVWDAFQSESPPYLVGSALEKRGFRDVDVRLILDDTEWEAWGLGTPGHEHRNARWVALTLAWSQFGKAMTGLPIDFQIQQLSDANNTYNGRPRSALGLLPHRFTSTI
jgi:hypothetical protein